MGARSRHVRDGAGTGPVLCTADDIVPEPDRTSLAVGAVALVLLLGLINMMRADRRTGRRN